MSPYAPDHYNEQGIIEPKKISKPNYFPNLNTLPILGFLSGNTGIFSRSIHPNPENTDCTQAYKDKPSLNVSCTENPMSLP